MSTRRKMLAADERIAKKIVEIAQRRGSTVFQTVNDILDQAVKADAMGVLLSEVIDDREVLERAKKKGFTFTVEKLLYEMVDLAFDHVKDPISEMWFETGLWYGEYFASRNSEPLREFREAMKLLNLGTSEFSVETGKSGDVSVTCVGEAFTSGYTEALSFLIEGIFKGLKFNLKEKENLKGIIRLKFSKLGEA